eukprot:scaffold39793_cov57-Phaeocystis_antarctica.AAC.3
MRVECIACGAGWAVGEWARGQVGEKEYRARRYCLEGSSTHAHVPVVCLARAAGLEGVCLQRTGGGAHRVRVLLAAGRAQRRGRRVDEAGLHGGDHRGSRTRRRHRGAADVQGERGGGDEGEHDAWRRAKM